MIEKIIENLRTQDNRATENPIFLVRGKIRIYGVNPDHAEGWAWLDEEGNEMSEDDIPEGESIGDYATNTPFIERWEVITACLTMEAAKEYIREHANRLALYVGVDIYAETLRGNHEMIAIRQFLLSGVESERQMLESIRQAVEHGKEGWERYDAACKERDDARRSAMDHEDSCKAARLDAAEAWARWREMLDERNKFAAQRDEAIMQRDDARKERNKWKTRRAAGEPCGQCGGIIEMKACEATRVEMIPGALYRFTACDHINETM